MSQMSLKIVFIHKFNLSFTISSTPLRKSRGSRLSSLRRKPTQEHTYTMWYHIVATTEKQTQTQTQTNDWFSRIRSNQYPHYNQHHQNEQPKVKDNHSENLASAPENIIPCGTFAQVFMGQSTNNSEIRLPLLHGARPQRRGFLS